MVDFINCKIFCFPSIDLLDFRREYSNFLDVVQTSNSFFKHSNYQLTIHKNQDFDDIRSKEFPDGFLFFKILIEFEFNENCAEDYCIKVISSALTWLWEKGFPAVASYALELQLPNQGGYNNLNVPWL
jgi:hypothetical protein